MRPASGNPATGAVGLAANSALRAATIGIKAVLIIALAIWLEPGELGIYGLIAATITLTTYLYGLDFYTFTLRELSTGDLSDARFQVRDQFVLFGAVYCLGSLVLVVVLHRFGLDPALIALTAATAVLQHAAIEFYRVLVRIERSIVASICLFVRDAAWVPACLLVWVVRGDVGLFEVLLFWLIGSLLSVAFAARSLLRLLPNAGSRPINWAWLAQGVRTGLRMLPGTISLRGLFTVDRMILALLAPPEVLGAYVFFVSLCGAFSSLFETGLLPFFWPRLLEAVKRDDRAGREAAQRALARVCLIGAPAFAVIAIAVGYGFAQALPNDAYAENLELLLYVAAAYMFLTISNVPHYRLYAEKRDLAIVASNTLAFAGFLAAVGLLALVSKALAVPVALVLACILLLALKLAVSRRGHTA